VAILGAIAWGVLALARGESVNAVWLFVAALCSYAIADRFYALFIANRVLQVDDRRATPAERSTTTSTSSRPTGGCCSATTSPSSPGPARWSAGSTSCSRCSGSPTSCWPRSP
jgi:hypothetical protein